MSESKYESIRHNIKGIVIFISVGYLVFDLIYYLTNHFYELERWNIQTLGYVLGNMICFCLSLSTAYHFFKKIHDKRIGPCLDTISLCTLAMAVIWNLVEELNRGEILSSGIYMIPILLFLLSVNLMTNLY